MSWPIFVSDDKPVLVMLIIAANKGEDYFKVVAPFGYIYRCPYPKRLAGSNRMIDFIWRWRESYELAY